MAVLGRTCRIFRIGAVAGLGLTSVAQGQPSVVVGRVFDSLRMKPLAGVLVSIAGTANETSSDSTGVFRLTTDLSGPRTLTLTEPRLDRLLGTVSIEAVLKRGDTLKLDFAIPRVPPTPASLCPGSGSRGATLGVVRDSATRLPISSAIVAAFWMADSSAGGEGRGIQGQSGEDGGFLLCGLPIDRPVAILARSPGREVGVSGLRPTVEAIVDVDLFSQPTADTLLGHLRGRVVDSATRTALVGADIMLVESGLHATSDTDGGFAIGQVLAGRVALVARRIGYRPQFLEATVPAGGTATVEAVLQPAPVRLEELETRVAPLERDFAERLRLGLGKFWVEDEIRRFDGSTITALLGRKAQIREARGGVLMNYSRGRNCAVPVVMDGTLFPATYLRPDQIARAEYYSGPAQVPNDFQSFHLRANGFGCGLLVLWTRGR